MLSSDSLSYETDVISLLAQGTIFFLLQSEEGDLYKVTIEHEDEEVQSLKIKYFETVQIASSLCILKSGFLFVASEFGNQYLYQFEKLGDDDDEIEFSSTDYPDFGAGTHALPPASFRPRPLKNLVLADEAGLRKEVETTEVVSLELKTAGAFEVAEHNLYRIMRLLMRLLLPTVRNE